MKKTIQVTYLFDIKYEHSEGLERIEKELEKSPLFDFDSAGRAIDGKIYGCSCKIKENSGEIKR